jgi:hypothetical protein
MKAPMLIGWGLFGLVVAMLIAAFSPDNDETA